MLTYMFQQMLTYEMGVLAFFVAIVIAAGFSERLWLVLLAHLVVSACVIGLDLQWVEAARTAQEQQKQECILLIRQSSKEMAEGIPANKTGLGEFFIEAGLTNELQEMESIAEKMRQGSMTANEGVLELLRDTSWTEGPIPDMDAIFVIGVFLRLLFLNACLVPLSMGAFVLHRRLWTNAEEGEVNTGASGG